MNLKDYEYYRTDLGVLYCGCSLKLGKLIKEQIDLLYTDPIWPNNKVNEFKKINPYKLFKKMYKKIKNVDRIAIQLGCDSDIRILSCIKEKFIRTVWLRYALPGHKGRILYSGDVGYYFGKVPKSIKGRHLLRGEYTSSNNFGKEADHPCPRKLEHVEFIISEMSRKNEIVLDPFIGSGTTAVACEKLGRKWIGIEISEKYCEIAKQRIKAEADQIKLF